MVDSPKLPIGRQVRHYRRKNGNRSQAAIAGLCGITERYLSLIETGKKTPSPDVLARLARELGVPMSALLSDEPHPESGVSLSTVPDIARALMGYTGVRAGAAVTPAELRDRVEEAWRTWQTSEERFSEVEQVLPQLIADVECAVRAYRTGEESRARREVLRTSADLYGLLRSYCRRTGRLDLALMVADRARRAAEDADDPIRLAAAHWNFGHCLLSQEGGADEAGEIAEAAVQQLQDVPDSDEKAAMQGALELVCVVADAQSRRWWHARQRLEEQAAPLAQRAGEANIQWTVFGPTNIHLHALSIEMLAGEGAEGLRLADEVDISRLPSRERQFTFTLEVARCYDLRRDDAAVLVHLLDLEKLSPQDMVRSKLATDMVLGLLDRVRPTYRRQTLGLAERLGVV
ncbi:helix-turn-helix domain-containing protein [Streptomyces sp. MMG1121]|uniref:helix-turn-helix domain-containing protein n=1 Tax=Streptomyces sp. MMG1121 TaxID=1415544 RepID=UPI0006AE7E68|nr:helix-turn-helix transcriptional regulator [Streptomyces sp. MMG1121]KOV62866.1 transcriptional regulator [Streptomyces sp. MMG1121]